MRRVKLDVTIDSEVMREIDKLRGMEKRSPFVEHLLRIGLEACKSGQFNLKREEESTEK
jgi:metal-responsive CopG/Arc/MetJ family transcriptional regulator